VTSWPPVPRAADAAAGRADGTAGDMAADVSRAALTAGIAGPCATAAYVPPAAAHPQMPTTAAARPATPARTRNPSHLRPAAPARAPSRVTTGHGTARTPAIRRPPGASGNEPDPVPRGSGSYPTGRRESSASTAASTTADLKESVIPGSRRNPAADGSIMFDLAAHYSESREHPWLHRFFNKADIACRVTTKMSPSVTRRLSGLRRRPAALRRRHRQLPGL